MELTEHSCKRCGGSLISVGGNRWKCQYCGRIYDEEAAVKNTRTMREMFDETKQEVINNLRRNLYDAVNAEYISNTDVKNACVELKKYLPDDFAVNFYEAACGSNLKRLTQFIRRIDVDSNLDEIESIINFLIKSLQTEYLLELNNLVEKAYKQRDLKLYEKYATLISVEAEKVSMGVYETKLPREVFIAYSSKDMDKVSELCEVLEAQGLQCFVAARNLRHGKGSVENYDKALKEAMDHCKSFVFVSSLNSRSLSCDALEIEIPYVRHADIENSPAEYRNNYISIPHKFKKPRVEYRIQESRGFNAADGITNEFFDGYERVYSPEEVAGRILKQLVEVPATEASAASKASDGGKRICVACGTENEKGASFCAKCGGKQFVSSVSEYISIKNRQELDESRRREAERVGSSSSAQAPQKKKGKGGIIAAVAVIAVIVVIIVVIAASAGSKKAEYDTNKDGIISVIKPSESDYVIQHKPGVDETEKNNNNGENGELYDEISDVYANISYKITYDGVLTISGSGDMPDFSEGSAPWCADIDFASETGYYKLFSPYTEINTIIVEEGITSIGSYAFRNFYGVKTISLASSVKRIGEYAFAGCGSLDSIDLSNVTDIQNHAFYECGALKQLTLGDSVEHIGENAFLYTSVYDDYYQNNAVVIGSCLIKAEGGYDAQYTIPDGVVCIADFAFYENYSITEIVIPEGVKYIGKQAFSDCDALVSVSIPASVVSIGESAFDHGANLKSVAIAEGSQLTSVGTGIFQNCDALKSINLENATLLTEISDEMFYNCTALTEFEIPSSITKIGISAFGSCSGLTNVIIPASVTSIGEYGFDACYNLETVIYNGSADEWELIQKGGRWNQNMGSNTSNGLSTVVHMNGAYDSSTAEKYTAGLKFGMNSDGTGYFVKSFDGNIGDVVIPSTYLGMPVTEISSCAFQNNMVITSVQIPASIVKIGESAFNNANNLVSVTFADGGALSELGTSAFHGCEKLESIRIPKGVAVLNSTFYYCSSLSAVEFEEGSMLLEIGTYVFYECSSLKSINIPDSVTKIGDSAFSYCGLESLTFGEESQLISIGDNAFNNCSSMKSLTLPVTLTEVGSWAFEDLSGLEYLSIPAELIGNFSYRSNLKEVVFKGEKVPASALSGSIVESVTLADTVTEIGDYAFDECEKLKSITFGSGLVTIGNSAIAGCISLESIVIPDSVESLGTYALSGNTALTFVTIGSGISSIPENCFAGCSALKSIEIPDTVTSIASAAFAGAGLESVALPDGITEILYGTFSNCENLTSIVIPNSVTSIDNYAFGSNTKIKSASFPIGVASNIPKTNLEHIVITDGDTIPGYTFQDCVKLQSVVLPDTEGLIIGAYAFIRCSSLTSITLPVTLEDIAMNAFQGCYALAEVINHTNKTITAGDTETLGGVAANALIVHSGESLLDETEDGFVFITVDGVHHMIGYVGNATEIVFPADYNGETYQVRKRLFYENQTITSVSISGVETVPDELFYHCYYIESITIGDGVKYIGNYAFYDCDAAETVVIGDDVISIGEYAFAECLSLKTLTLGQSLESIGASAFYYCMNSLERVVIPSSVTFIGKEAFRSCDHLSGVRFEDSDAQWGIYSDSSDSSPVQTVSVSSTVTNADNLRENLVYYVWKRIVE